MLSMHLGSFIDKWKALGSSNCALINTRFWEALIIYGRCSTCWNPLHLAWYSKVMYMAIHLTKFFCRSSVDSRRCLHVPLPHCVRCWPRASWICWCSLIECLSRSFRAFVKLFRQSFKQAHKPLHQIQAFACWANKAHVNVLPCMCPWQTSWTIYFAIYCQHHWSDRGRSCNYGSFQIMQMQCWTPRV